MSACLPIRLTQSSSIAINTSHVDIARLDSATKEPLILKLVREPQLGVIQFDGRNWTGDAAALRLSVSDLAANSVLYHQSGSSTPPGGLPQVTQLVFSFHHFASTLLRSG